MTHSHEEIEIRAYQLWQDRGHPWGSPDVDWYCAEHELTEREDGLIELAREVGRALGDVVAFIGERLPNAPS